MLCFHFPPYVHGCPNDPSILAGAPEGRKPFWPFRPSSPAPWGSGGPSWDSSPHPWLWPALPGLARLCPACPALPGLARPFPALSGPSQPCWRFTAPHGHWFLLLSSHSFAFPTFSRFPRVCKLSSLSRFPLFTDAFAVVRRLPDHPAAYQRRSSALVTFRCSQRPSAAPAFLRVSLVPSVGLHLAARVPDILQHVHGPQRRRVHYSNLKAAVAVFRNLQGPARRFAALPVHPSTPHRFPGTSGPSPPYRTTEDLLELGHRRARWPSPALHLELF